MVGVGKDGKRTDIGYRASSTFPIAHSWDRDPNPILNQLHTGGPVHVRQGAPAAHGNPFGHLCLSSQQIGMR